MSEPKVWNLRDKHRVRIPRDAVYCGRGTPWGNPFIAGTHGSRVHVIKRFVEEVLPDLDVSALRGKHLLCWCKPLPCHCDHILEKANRPMPNPDIDIDAILNFRPQLVDAKFGPEISILEMMFRFYDSHDIPTDKIVEILDGYAAALKEEFGA